MSVKNNTFKKYELLNVRKYSKIMQNIIILFDTVTCNFAFFFFFFYQSKLLSSCVFVGQT